jgi:hypothetical protein
MLVEGQPGPCIIINYCIFHLSMWACFFAQIWLLVPCRGKPGGHCVCCWQMLCGSMLWLPVPCRVRSQGGDCACYCRVCVVALCALSVNCSIPARSMLLAIVSRCCSQCRSKAIEPALKAGEAPLARTVPKYVVHSCIQVRRSFLHR